MYDTLIDHEIDEHSVADVETQLGSKNHVATDDNDTDQNLNLEIQDDSKDDDDMSLELDGEAVDSESWSDDPVRMYLTQMGEIPLLTRQEEINLARRIETTRTAFRRRLLACDFVIRAAYKVLSRVHRGELPFDRTVQVSVTDRLEKEQILGRLPHNLRTLEVLLQRNEDDYRIATSKSERPALRRQAWKRLADRRRRAVMLIEELGLRTQRIEPMIAALEDFSERVDELQLQLKQMKKDRAPLEQRKPLLIEYRNILRMTQESPTSLRHRVNDLKKIYSRYQRAKRGLSEGNLATGRVDRQEVSQSRLELPGLDSGRQRRTDASGRQV